jgi:hypothetical protein
MSGHDVDLLERLHFEALYMSQKLTKYDWTNAGYWWDISRPGPFAESARKRIAKTSCEAMQESLKALSKTGSVT